MEEILLTGGNATNGVVRVGSTVRKPWTAAWCALFTTPVRPMSRPPTQPGSHILAPGAELICHNDLAPWNLLVGDRWVFIDWDAAAPSTRLWDLAYAAQAFTLNDASADPRVAARALAAFIDGYGADDELRAALPVAMWQRTAAMHELLKNSHVTGIEPWGTMFTTGHGDHWNTVTQFVRNNESLLAEAIRTVRYVFPLREPDRWASWLNRPDRKILEVRDRAEQGRHRRDGLGDRAHSPVASS